MTLSMRLARVEVRTATYKELPFKVRGLFIYYIYYLQNTKYAIINNTCLVSKVNIVSPLKVKNEPREAEMEHAFILGSMDCTVVNNHDATKENPSKQFSG
jgi:hypothetical protein